MLSMHLQSAITRVYAASQSVGVRTCFVKLRTHRRYRSELPTFFIASLVALQMTSTTFGANDTDKLRFFETKVRPLLAAVCFECHSTDKVEGGLRLDTATTYEQEVTVDQSLCRINQSKAYWSMRSGTRI